MEPADDFEPEETRASDEWSRRTLPSDSASYPESVEEFSILKLIGRGGFGSVFLAYDNTLHREVALKIPHPKLVGKKRTVESYLSEARAIASLDHPGIIPVFRASSTPEVPCYIVTKLIRGDHLGKWAKGATPYLYQGGPDGCFGRGRSCTRAQARGSAPRREARERFG